VAHRSRGASATASACAYPCQDDAIAVHASAAYAGRMLILPARRFSVCTSLPKSELLLCILPHTHWPCEPAPNEGARVLVMGGGRWCIRDHVLQ
jgi:hypothetical protein